MVLFTMIARITDGLPLAASVQDDEQAGRDLQHYQNQAKQLFRRLNANSPERHSLETGAHIFHYLIDRGVCYLVLCEKTFSVKMAYGYLDELKSEFIGQYGPKIDTVARPYPFIEFDVYMQRVKRKYVDSRARHELDAINADLRDIHDITVQNINDVIERGEALSSLGQKASTLSDMSAKYHKNARKLNLKTSAVKIFAIVIVIVILLLILWYIIF